MSNNLLELISKVVEPEIIVPANVFVNGDKRYALIEDMTQKAIDKACASSNGTISVADFIDVYEEVADIIQKRILIK